MTHPEEPVTSSPAAGSEAQANVAATAPPSPAPDPANIARERTRTKVAFNSLLAGVVLLILLLVFILENTQSVRISYFGANGHIPLGVALLLAALAGALLVGLAGAARVLQLRRRMRRFHK